MLLLKTQNYRIKKQGRNKNRITCIWSITYSQKLQVHLLQIILFIPRYLLERKLSQPKVPQYLAKYIGKLMVM